MCVPRNPSSLPLLLLSLSLFLSLALVYWVCWYPEYWVWSAAYPYDWPPS